MKGCIKCAFVTEDFKDNKCPSCGEPLRVVFHQDYNDILVTNLSDEDSENYGHHLGCGGLVVELPDSRGGKVYVCLKCCLRIREREINTIPLMKHPEEFAFKNNKTEARVSGQT